jgi:hypothetical protein
MNSFTFIAYYTPNYQEILDTCLKNSFDRLELKNTYIKQIKPCGNWKKNTDYKPLFIKEYLEQSTLDIVYLDVDATITSYPTLFYELPSEFDIGIHLYNEGDYYKDRTRKELLTGTLYFRNNSKVIDLLTTWISLLNNFQFEQHALAEALKQHPEINIYYLPIEYCYIPVLSNGETPYNQVLNPIICQWQASRSKREEL